jgi:hypothetical protein
VKGSWEDSQEDSWSAQASQFHTFDFSLSTQARALGKLPAFWLLLVQIFMAFWSEWVDFLQQLKKRHFHV